MTPRSECENCHKPIWFKHDVWTSEDGYACPAIAEGNDEHVQAGTSRPTYEDLAKAFWTFLAASNNAGAPVKPGDADVLEAYRVLDRSGVESPYPLFGVGSG